MLLSHSRKDTTSLLRVETVMSQIETCIALRDAESKRDTSEANEIRT